MADQLLSINDANIRSVANAIKDKAGINRSVPLEFPDDFVDTLQGITTEATVTPKISPQQVTLTKDSTSFPIAAGFHDGNGTVGITLQSKTVTPNSSQQTVEPDTGKLLSQVIVNAMGSGYRLAQGTVTYNSLQESITISGYGFTAAGFVLLHTNIPEIASSGAGSRLMLLYTYNDSSSYNSVADWNPDYIEASSISGVTAVMYGSAGRNMETNSYNSLTLRKREDNGRFNGTYFYVIWGN